MVEITEEGAREHIDKLAKRYIGQDKYPGPVDEIRVTYRVKPQHILTFG